MIFKVIDSDIDKWTAKITVFGKSLYELDEAVDQAWGNSRFNDSTTFFNELTNNLHNLFTKQIKSINVDEIIPKIDSDTFDFQYWIDELNNVDKKVKAGTKTWQDYSNELDNNQKWIAQWGQQTEGTIRTQEDMIHTNIRMRNGLIAEAEAVKQQTLSYRLLTIAKNAAVIAGKILLTLAISKAISLIIKGVDNLIHKIDNCKEKVDDLMSSFNDALSKAKDNEATIKGLSDRYEELSEGVGNLGENVSLTTEEYEEYNSIVNQIADMFPELIQGYTAEGNAILNFGDDCKSAAGKVKELLQSEQDATFIEATTEKFLINI